MREFDPAGYQQMLKDTGYHEEQQMQESIQYANQAVNQPNMDFPFENVPATESGFQAIENDNQVEQKPGAVEQNFNAIQYGEPVNEEMKTEEKAKNNENEDEIKYDNPWNQPEILAELNVFHEHKKRLKIENDRDLLPHVRDYFKDENAKISFITPENIKEFNSYLSNLQA